MNENPNVNENTNTVGNQTPQPVVPTTDTNPQPQVVPSTTTSTITATPVVNNKEGQSTPPSDITIQNLANPAPQAQPVTPINTQANPETGSGKQPETYVSNTPNVNPVLKETSKVSFSNTKKEEKEPESSVASPMEEQKEPRKTRSVIPLIIFFIFLCFFIFFLPDINDYFKEKEGAKKLEAFEQQLREEEERQKKEEEAAKKEEEKQQQEEKKYQTLVCISPPTQGADGVTTVTTTKELTHVDDKLRIEKSTKNIHYIAADENYQQRKNICENKTIATVGVTGYEFSCSVSELSIEESSKFDLKDFKTQTITNEDGSEERITSEYQYDSSLKEIKQALESEGYTCR